MVRAYHLLLSEMTYTSSVFEVSGVNDEGSEHCFADTSSWKRLEIRE